MTRPQTGVLALDLGTSSVRAVVYDQRGRLVDPTFAEVPYQLDTSMPGQASSDADQLVDLIEGAIDDAVKAAKKEKLSVAAVAASCYWHSLMGVDRAGRPTTELLTWADTRSQPGGARRPRPPPSRGWAPPRHWPPACLCPALAPIGSAALVSASGRRRPEQCGGRLPEAGVAMRHGRHLVGAARGTGDARRGGAVGGFRLPARPPPVCVGGRPQRGRQCHPLAAQTPRLQEAGRGGSRGAEHPRRRPRPDRVALLGRRAQSKLAGRRSRRDQRAVA